MAWLLLSWTILAGAAALRPPSRFAGRGGNAARKRVLPIYAPPRGAPPTAPLPVPGSKRKFRLAVDTAAQLEMVKDLRKYGAFVHVVETDEDGDERVGVVCDVVMAQVADDAPAGAVVATSEGADARVRIGRTAKIFPYEAAECEPLPDGGLTEDDALAAYDVVEEDGGLDLEAARENCIDVLSKTLELCASRDPGLGAVDTLTGEAIADGEYSRMRARLLEAADFDEDFEDDEATAALMEKRDRALSFACLALVDAPANVRRQCLLTRSAARRYGAVARHVAPLYKELSSIAALGALGGSVEARCRPAPVDAPLAFAALRPGRRVAYWWSDEAGWAAGAVDAVGVADAAGDVADDVAVAFDADGSCKNLALLGADRGRWKLLPL